VRHSSPRKAASRRRQRDRSCRRAHDGVA